MTGQAAAESSIPIGTIVAGRFRVERPLTEGGMATVFVASDLEVPGTERALKIMAPRLLNDDKSRERFEQEATIGSVLKHPHIVEVLGAGVDPALESPWIAMELLQGGTIAGVLRERGPFPPDEVRALFLRFGAAMAAAHSRGVVHRDLKPENVFLEARPNEGLPFTLKVLDFGIAKVRKDNSMKNSQLIGSPLWMAPEQLSAGTSIGPFTDVWPFGLLAFYALTGKSYWLVANEGAMNLPKLLAEILAADLVAPTARARQLGVEVTWPEAFDAWFLRCVARDPAARFATVGDAAAELDVALTARETREEADSVPYRATEPAPIPTYPPPAVPKVDLEPAPSTPAPAKSRAPYAMVVGALVLLAAALAAWLRFGS
ncbi:MAG: serine/threonine-protein kinase [Sandaracinus sp.]